MRELALVTMLVIGCGRMHFDPLGDPLGDGGGSSGRCVVDLAAGNSHTCALLRDGRVRCWGENAFGQLGDGTFMPRPTPDLVRMTDGTPLANIVQITAGVQTTTCAVRDDRTAWCWGANANGQLGNGETIDLPNPVRTLVDDVIEIRTGEQHTCAIRGDRELWCWGLADSGRLANSAVGAQLGHTLVPLGEVTHLVTSFAHTCAMSFGEPYCWGWNADGQLGNGSNISTPTPQRIPLAGVSAIASAWRATCFMNGDAYCAGNNMYGELGNGTMTDSNVPVPVRDSSGAVFDRVLALGAGDVHGCALRDDGSVWCWGNNSSDQLGRPGPSTLNPVEVGLGSPAIKLAVGNDHACAALADESIQCWGENASGELGDGTTDRRVAPVSVALTCP